MPMLSVEQLRQVAPDLSVEELQQMVTDAANKTKRMMMEAASKVASVPAGSLVLIEKANGETSQESESDSERAPIKNELALKGAKKAQPSQADKQRKADTKALQR